MAVNHVKMDDEDPLDILFWMKKGAAERLLEVTRLRRKYFTWRDGSFPEKIERVVHQRKM